MAQGRSKQLADQATSDYGFLDPTLIAEAKNPQGYTPQQLAYMNTASQQSLGGSVGGVTGQANLQSARTRNAGAFQGAISSAARGAQRQLSQNALGIQENQAKLQLAERQQALASLQNLYGTEMGGGLNYLNASTGALEGENRSHPIQSAIGTGAGVLGALSGGAQTGYNIYSGK